MRADELLDRTKLSAFYRKWRFYPIAGGSPEPIKTASPASRKPGQKELDGSIADLDFDDVPENIREQVISFTTQKSKQLQSGFTKKTEELKKEREKLEVEQEELSGLRKIQEEFKQDPELGKVVEKVYYDYKSGKLAKPGVAEKHQKTIDKLLETASVEDRQGLLNLKDIIEESTSGHLEKTSNLEQEVKTLREEIKNLRSVSSIGLTEKISKDLNSLKERFGSEVVDKYAGELKTLANKYPQQDMQRIFYQIADEKDLKNALLKEAEVEKKKETERQKEGFEPSGIGVVGTIEAPKDKGGRVIMGGQDGFISRILRKHNLLK